MKNGKEIKHSGNIDGSMREEIRLKRQLVEATDSVRKKFNSLKNRNVNTQLTLEKMYEPITKPLKVISSASELKLQKQLPTEVQKKPTQPQESVPASTSTSTFKAAASEASDEDDENEAAQAYLMETPPRSSIMSTPSSERSFDSEGDVIKQHIENLKSGDHKYDTIFGVRLDPHTDKLRMGNVEIRFSNGNIALWYGNKNLGTYSGSPKLYDVIFMRYPLMLRSKEDAIDDEEYQIYGEILKKTNAAYKNYDVRQGLNKNRWKKFNEIIEPLLSSSTVMTRSKTGLGFPHMSSQKLYNSRGVDYVYWNKPKELVDRLRLLYSSKMAGNTGVDNEILSLVEEMREEGIIY